MPDQDAAQTWRYGSSLPQRLSRNYARYRERGGRIDLYGDADAYAENGRLQDCERLMFLLLAFDQIHKEGLSGDVAELGVYKGQTATVLARNARRLGRTCWLLDTFAGFDAKDFTGADAGRGPQFADTSLAAVRARVGEENTRYIQVFSPIRRRNCDRTGAIASSTSTATCTHRSSVRFSISIRAWCPAVF